MTITDEPRQLHTGHDIAAEQIVLGAMMLSDQATDEAAEIVRATDFYQPRHATLFTAIIGLRAKGEPAEATALTRLLIQTGDIAKIDATYLHDLIAAVPTAASVSWYAQVVAEHAQWRNLATAATRIAQMAGERNLTIAEACDRADRFLTEATVRHDRKTGQAWREIIGPAVDAIEAAGDRDEPLGLPTGIADLDRMLYGLRPGQLVILGGRPGMGKSILAIDIARHNAMRHKTRAAVFSLEMSTPEIANRIISAETNIPGRALEKGRLSDADWVKVTRFQAELLDAPLVIDDSADATLADIRSKVRQMHRREPLGLVVVDYLQLMATSGRSENRALEVAEMSRGLKLLAKEIGCPVVAASQLNRNPEGRADRRPQLSDLRESGGIEQDADIVILLHRDAYYDPNSRPGEVDLIVAKNRNGPLGSIAACAQLHYTRIVDFAAEVPA